ncbi:Hypothetical protein SRAE_0000061600 [Strongyloides ratti]|uniref:Reverse transcriptase domain-containing protein n=1 Tax=Strongyloides ratti TaxID=34506 RepID=A0A090MT47_STRRB|nr:Hypothetical protein SRAE_0000061600 [Strongyloides ratti]CEF61493.1 Hypothetical protein SRAE_0000061600 [Strongyloides ratti]
MNWDKLATSTLVRNFRKSHSTIKYANLIKTEFSNEFRLLSKLETLILENEPLLRDNSSLLCNINTDTIHKNSIHRINKFLEDNPALWDDSHVSSTTFVTIPFPTDFVPTKAPLIRFAKHLRDVSKDILDNDFKKVVNPKNLNNQIIIPKHMTQKMNTMKDIQEKLANYYKGSSDYCFSTFDIKSAYRNCKLHPNQSKYLQFVTEFGTYEPTSLIFGLNVSSYLFIHTLSRIMQGLHISKHGISIPEYKKIQYRSFSHPTNLIQIKQFVQSLNYYRSMIPEFSNITDNFYAMKSFRWTDIEISQFNRLVDILSENIFLSILPSDISSFSLTIQVSYRSICSSLFWRSKSNKDLFDLQVRIDSILIDFTQPITLCAMKKLTKIDDFDSYINLANLINSYSSDLFAPILTKIACGIVPDSQDISTLPKIIAKFINNDQIVLDSNNVIRINNNVTKFILLLKVGQKTHD